ncbi:MAG: ornithine carbamoyltransferase, partial [Candidatus Goldiibacteriota bacterium]
KDLISILDLSSDELGSIINVAEMIRVKHKNREMFFPLLGKSLAMIFTKSSTRTRVSFEIAMFQLGGAALYLNPQDMQLGRGETIADTAKVLSRYVDGIMIRTYAHSDVLELGQNASIPVINGLTDDEHPCQIIADILTIKDRKKSVKGLKVAYIGDGNNVCNSWLYAAPKAEMHMAVASPAGYLPKDNVVSKARELAALSKTQILLTESPEEAVKDADVIYTDVWASMGQEAEAEKRKKEFARYQVNSVLLKHARKDCLVMHCLPAHRGEEISAEVMDGANSVVFDEAENRLHAQKAILALLMGK